MKKKLTLVALKKIETESRKITKACREGKLPRGPRYSKKARAVTTAINKADLCYGPEVRDILQAVMGISLPPTEGEDGDKFFVKHAVIVCTRNPNSHSYGRKPALLLRNSWSKHLRVSGTRGNDLPTPYKIDSPIRYAIGKEVTAFFKAIRQRIRDKKNVAYYD